MAKPRNIFAGLNSPEPTSTRCTVPGDRQIEDRARTRGRVTDYFCRVHSPEPTSTRSTVPGDTVPGDRQIELRRIIFAELHHPKPT